MADAVQRAVIVDSEAIAARGSTLFAGAATFFANGELPSESLGYAEAVVISTDRSRIDALCGAFIAAGCKSVKELQADLTEVTEREQIVALAKSPAFKPYLPSVPNLASSPNPAPEPKPPVPNPPPIAAVEAPDAGPVAAQQELRGARRADSGTDSTKAKGPQDDPAAPLPAQEPAGSAQSDEPPGWHSEIPDGAQTSQKPFQRKRRPRLAAVDGNLAHAPDPDDEPMPAELSEDALAEHFVATRGNFWRYVPEWSLWLEWRGDGWHRDTLHKVAHECKEITREALEWRVQTPLTADGKRKLSSKRMAWNVRDMAATHPKISILASQLDADPMLLGVPGGVVDLRNGKLLEAEPEQYITRRCLVSPEAGEHPLFDRVLARACAEHDGMRDYLLRWFGYMLTGDVRAEAFIFLYGPGGSGKSTLIKTLTEIAGDYAVSISMDALMEQKNPRHTQEIAKLAGMRLIYASETSEGRLWNEALIKDLTGRDAVTARFMRGNDFTFKPCGKLLLYGNAMPRLKSVGEEIKRRIHLVEYAGSLTEEERDNTLKDRLVEEYPAILATLIRGAVDFQDCGGLGKPESVIMSVDSYLEGEDSFALFMDECIDRDVVARERSSEVYRRYRTWASAAGEYVMSQKRFVQTLRARGFDSKRSASGMLITGLRLRAPAPSEHPPWQQD